jgi:hypothetical protein
VQWKKEGVWMKIASRVVIIKGKDKGQTGAIVNYDEGVVTVMLDSGYVDEYRSNEMLEIDDISGIGNIQFKKGMKVYDAVMNMVGEIISEEKLDDGLIAYSIKFQNGMVLRMPVDEETNYIVIENAEVMGVQGQEG